jgi:hypothetical protein
MDRHCTYSGVQAEGRRLSKQLRCLDRRLKTSAYLPE